MKEINVPDLLTRRKNSILDSLLQTTVICLTKPSLFICFQPLHSSTVWKTNLTFVNENTHSNKRLLTLMTSGKVLKAFLHIPSSKLKLSILWLRPNYVGEVVAAQSLLLSLFTLH